MFDTPLESHRPKRVKSNGRHAHRHAPKSQTLFSYLVHLNSRPANHDTPRPSSHIDTGNSHKISKVDNFGEYKKSKTYYSPRCSRSISTSPSSRKGNKRESEVDPLMHRLRRLEEIQTDQPRSLRGSVDRSQVPRKVNFCNEVAVNFYNYVEPKKVESLKNFIKDYNCLRRHSTSRQLDATDSILAKKRIPGFSSNVDRPSDFISIPGKSTDDDLYPGTDGSSFILKSEVEPVRKSSLKSKVATVDSTDSLNGKKSNSEQNFFRSISSLIESEVDPQCFKLEPTSSVTLLEQAGVLPMQPKEYSTTEIIRKALKWFLCCSRNDSTNIESERKLSPISETPDIQLPVIGDSSAEVTSRATSPLNLADPAISVSDIVNDKLSELSG